MVAAPDIPDARVAVVGTYWNSNIITPLTRGAVDTLAAHGVDPAGGIDVLTVPGAVELTFAAARLIASRRYDAVILLGCVIRGGTPHFDYVCQSVTEGMTRLNAAGDVPVVFGVLTVDTEQDAVDRAGGRLGNKGAEAAEAALNMIAFARRFPTRS
jgi:6,7-dimethyl-8-ribityllumazine synthase